MMAGEHSNAVIQWLRPLILIFGLAAAVAAAVAVILWSQGPDYRTLFANLERRDAAEVVQALQSHAVDYRIDAASGAVQVPVGQLHAARLQLAGEGLPRSAASGFEMMSESSGLGVSEFMENARFQHALETELSRTISSLRPVQGARVHLAVPKPSVFMRESRKPSASVALRLFSGRSLSSDQVAAVVNMVASSVPGLAPEDVAVVDDQGRLLSRRAGEAGMTGTEQQFDYARRIEETLAGKIEEILTPMLGAGRVHATVVAAVDFSVREQTRESFDPNRTVVRAEQTSEQKQSMKDAAGGVPGALANQPPQAAESVALEEASAEGAAAEAESMPLNESSSATRNYEVDRTISHEKQGPGRIERLSVAVLVDDLKSINQNGEVVSTSLSEEQLARVTDLVRDAVGYSEARGDSVSVMNTTFQPTEAVPEPDTAPLWQQPVVVSIARQLIGALLVLLLAFLVLRPLLRGILSAPVLRTVDPALALSQQDGEVPTPASGQQPIPALAAVPEQDFEQHVQQARQMVNEDPKRVAQVVRGWVTQDA